MYTQRYKPPIIRNADNFSRVRVCWGMGKGKGIPCSLEFICYFSSNSSVKVLNIVNEIIENDAENGSPIAQRVRGTVRRKTIKQVQIP